MKWYQRKMEWFWIEMNLTRIENMPTLSVIEQLSYSHLVLAEMWDFYNLEDIKKNNANALIRQWFKNQSEEFLQFVLFLKKQKLLDYVMFADDKSVYVFKEQRLLSYSHLSCKNVEELAEFLFEIVPKHLNS